MIDYSGLEWILRINNKDRKYLHNQLGLSWPTISKFRKGESVSVSVLERICLEFNCNIGDICSIKKGPTD